jgi:hypothetical protein
VTPAILTLIMSGCDRSITTDAAFAHLAGIHTLNMSRCSQRTITDAAFAHLRGIVELVVDDSRRLTHADVAAIRAGTFAPRRQQR